MMTSCILVITLQTEIQHGLAIGWITGLLFMYCLATTKLEQLCKSEAFRALRMQ
jgi:hypothetical protein